MRKLLDHIVFDLDGTLIDSKPDIIRTYEAVFKRIAPDLPPDFKAMNFAATLQAVMESVYKDEEVKVKEAKALFVSIYDSSEYDQTILYESVYETLGELKRRGHQLYIATNKRYYPTQRILQYKRIAHFFTDVMTTDIHDQKKLSKEDMISELKQKHLFQQGFIVGDSAGDILAGQNQHLKTIAVTYGYEYAGIISSQSPTYTIDTLKEILNLL